ncbi:Ubiquitin-protein ligase [Handroanthus impetiginosus]|uniref:Ubiquitin-protein ligase n=1 Tax=Handroanthus impetiginosus TaxID=429701 RepID=A0A2G9GRE0_9LAMI|nr:Ubiquitin-protein ligase [Handroanthus impetiginosus]
MAEDKYNRKNPAVKRILQEVKEMQSNPSDDFMSLPLEENIFEWQFAITGPRDSEFEGGIYHGRIQLPAEYPFKPPSFMLLTPNGRFETQTKICLSISNHHPEHWQPSWSVRTALVALIAFMPTSPNGALGSLDYPKEERKALAIKSRDAAPTFGSPEPKAN